MAKIKKKNMSSKQRFNSAMQTLSKKYCNNCNSENASVPLSRRVLLQNILQYNTLLQGSVAMYRMFIILEL
jgi:hypothetical protein